jgi:uncharacterized protein
MRIQRGKFTAGPIILAMAVASLATSAVIAASPGYEFLKAVKELKSEDVERIINEPGTGAVLINSRDDSTGQTALHLMVEQEKIDWLGYLLAKGAKPDIADKRGATPLMRATQRGWIDGAALLIKMKAQVDATNRSGETALIQAVQLRNAEMVRLLMRSGANPDRQDSVAGYSARDYAIQDGRANAILQIIESGGKADPAAKPDNKGSDLDFSGIDDK